MDQFERTHGEQPIAEREILLYPEAAEEYLRRKVEAGRIAMRSGLGHGNNEGTIGKAWPSCGKAIIWAPQASRDRMAICQAITRNNAQAGARLEASLNTAITGIVSYPLLGQLGQISGTYEWLLKEDILLIYETGIRTTWVLAIAQTNSNSKN